MWRVVVNEVVGDILGPLELYLVEPVGEHGQVHVEDNVIAPARKSAVNRVRVPVVGRELIRRVIERSRVHVVLACAVGVLVCVGLEAGEAQFQCSLLSCLFSA